MLENVSLRPVCTVSDRRLLKSVDEGCLYRTIPCSHPQGALVQSIFVEASVGRHEASTARYGGKTITMRSTSCGI